MRMLSGQLKSCSTEHELGRELGRGCYSPQFLDSSMCSEKDMSQECRNQEIETAVETEETANACSIYQILMFIWTTQGALKIANFPVVQRVFISRRLPTVKYVIGHWIIHWEWQWVEEWEDEEIQKIKEENLRSSKNNVMVMFQTLRQKSLKKAGAFLGSTSAQIYTWFEK